MMDDPDDTTLLKFVARFAGWTELNKPLTEPLEGLPPGYEAESTWPVPNYLNSIDLWLRDVAPKIEADQRPMFDGETKVRLSTVWISRLVGICMRADGGFMFMNASARNRCLALWRALEGKLPDGTQTPQ